MSRAYQGYYSDYVVSTTGVPIVGATVNVYLASQFTVPPFPTGATGQTPVATATTDANGFYSLDKLIPDDYYIQVVYTPAGGATTYTWKYQVPIFTYEETRRTRERTLALALPRVLGKLHAGQSVTICCVGDSVTVGYNATGTVTGGYVAQVAAGLAALYPNARVNRLDPNSFGVTTDAAIPSWTTVQVQAGSGTPLQVITVVNCGVTGDTCLRVMRRFANLTANGYPDLVTLYLGFNDCLNTDTNKFVDAATFQTNLAALVNQVQSLTSAEVVLLPMHFNDNGGHSLPAIEPYAEATRAVAVQARCGLVDVRKLWMDHYDVGASNSGFGTWLDSTAGNYMHPSDVGHQIIATEVLRAFQTAGEAPVAQSWAPAALAGAKSLELVRYPWESGGILSTAMTIAGTWTAQNAFQNNNLVAATNAAGTGTEYRTSTTGDSISFKGRFTELYMLCRRWADSGQVSVVIDGGAAVTVDMYRAYPATASDLGDFNGAIAPQDRMLLASGLADVTHTVTLTLAATKNPSSTGFLWRFDSLEVVRGRKHGYEVEGQEPGMIVQRGSATVSLTAQATNTAAVTFPRPFQVSSGLPTVVATCGDAQYYASITALSGTGFTVSATHRDGSNATTTITVYWMAVSP